MVEKGPSATAPINSMLAREFGGDALSVRKVIESVGFPPELVEILKQAAHDASWETIIDACRLRCEGIFTQTGVYKAPEELRQALSNANSHFLPYLRRLSGSILWEYANESPELTPMLVYLALTQIFAADFFYACAASPDVVARLMHTRLGRIIVRMKRVVEAQTACYIEQLEQALAPFALKTLEPRGAPYCMHSVIRHHESMECYLCGPATASFDRMLRDKSFFDCAHDAHLSGLPVPETGGDEFIRADRPCVLLGRGEDSFAIARALAREGDFTILLRDFDREPPALYSRGKMYVLDSAFSGRIDYELRKPAIPLIDAITIHKEVTHAILSNEGIPVPPQLMIAPMRWSDPLRRIETETFAHIGLARFLKQYKRREIDRFIRMHRDIAVKPHDGMCGNEVILESRKKIIIQKIVELTRRGVGVVLEKRLHSAPFKLDGAPCEWNLRVFVSVDDNNEYAVSGIVARVEVNRNEPVNFSRTAFPLTFEKVAELLGLNEQQASDLRARVCDSACLAAWAIDRVAHGCEGNNVDSNERQDLFGIDVIIPREKGQLVPYILEVNNQESGGMWNHDTILPPERQGESCRLLAQRIAARARESFCGRH